MENKGKVLCRACETENDPGELTCRRCGLSMHANEQNGAGNMVSCPRCLYLNDPGSFFCYKCGKYFVEFEGGPALVANNKKNEAGNTAPPAAKVIMPGGTPISLSGAPTFIERSDFDGTMPNDLLMSISRQHLLITYENGVYYVQDYGRDGKGSTNHTRLNGADIYKKGKQPLKDGDKIELASQPELLLTFQLV
jgi:hypothetical protein